MAVFLLLTDENQYSTIFAGEWGGEAGGKMAETQVKQDQVVQLTRRQAMTALGLGAVTLTATHLGVAYEAAQWAEQEPRQTAADLSTEVEKLKGLLALYEG